MAYRRRQGMMGRSGTFKEETYPPPREAGGGGTPPPPPHSTSSSLAAQAIMASAAHRDSSHSSAYAHSSFKDHSKGGGGGPTYDYTSMEGSNEAGSFWGVLARKAKAILDDDNNVPYHSEYLIQPTPPPEPLYSSRLDHHQGDNSKKTDNPTLRKGLDALTTSMNRIGDSIGNALEEGRTIVESKTADLIQETRKIQIRRKENHVEGYHGTTMQNHTSQEDLLKASRDVRWPATVAMATAAKAKLLLRELKTVKADLAFAKQRCSQLEEENKILREAREKGVFPADDDMARTYSLIYVCSFIPFYFEGKDKRFNKLVYIQIRLQLETLLAEKARLAHENSIYARENRFLREIVEYHQLTMQDVVYLDEGIEEVTEVCPVSRMLSVSPPASPSRSSSVSRSSSIAKEMMSLSTATSREKNNNNNNNDTPSA
ncbi:hypothetical protein PHJA_002122200 [Phtheirospermum japonicum]|uniref:Uncharacterized protein n=1 Tax=Phtheirospermum japonicum TaxID=374723 RepID=A0A830D094_9LAMI|nr:hypothetical protein PHJA_002122200 [Phtheirospermum japonicum]